METIIPKLHASAPEPLGFGPSLEIRAFLLQRERGNLLIYRSATLEQDVEAGGALGGVSRQYLNHHHEASPACDWVARTFDAPLHVHEADARAASQVCNVDETFSERVALDEDFEIIPIPGHTSGATAFLWDTGQHRTLFTGDTVFFIRGRWRAAVLDGVSDRERYIESLELIRTLDFDIVVPGIASAGRTVKLPPCNDATVRNARSSNVMMRRERYLRASTTNEVSARPSSRSRWRRASPRATPSSSRVRHSTRKVPSARSSRKASSTSMPRRVRIR